MIDDVLSDAVGEIDRYLRWEIGPYTEGELRSRIVAVRDQMDALRSELDRLSTRGHCFRITVRQHESKSEKEIGRGDHGGHRHDAQERLPQGAGAPPPPRFVAPTDALLVRPNAALGGAAESIGYR